jgi:hypothetical protein
MSYWTLNGEMDKLQDDIKVLERTISEIQSSQGWCLGEGANSKHLMDKGAYIVTYFQDEIDFRKERISCIKSKLENVDSLLDGV